MGTHPSVVSDELAALLRERRLLYLEWALFLFATAGLFRIASMLENGRADAVSVFLFVGIAYSIFTLGFVQRFGAVMSHTCPRCHESLHMIPLRLVSRSCRHCGLTPYPSTAPSSNPPSA